MSVILSSIKLGYVFNAYEFGLFYQCLPNKIYHLKREKWSGGTKSRLSKRNSSSKCCRRKTFHVYFRQIEKPSLFKKYQTFALPVCHTKSSKICQIFKDWVHKCCVDERKIAVIIVNRLVHAPISKFLGPPNIASILQQMN